ncbi:hypothetical protein EDI_002710 [Entamoeba dispar SAW760]|uniref:Uncharacterized protein n=1 Tax=Entamoeba dispar (strain ATCC PRA-260 / SAW760) TaxID=370354 RepID=B0EJ99_ENTDS|nr:uncharacterized protein EDI_002710 [Entamoeba dispar SAW760]EDR25407.1 hypothetical protein EDI_002710 [Entamoeba dispar SAW760]|eukprot:EDR25407.1 hypothetical protein EDI_002710 [Entamoeba dispar SAW760]
MGSGISKNINQVIEEYDQSKSKEIFDSLELITIKCDEQEQIELYQNFINHESVRNKCIQFISDAIISFKKRDWYESSNHIILIMKLLPLVLPSLSNNILESFVLYLINSYPDYNPLLFLCLSKPLYKQPQLSLSLSSQYLMKLMKCSFDYSDEYSLLLTLLLYSDKVKHQIKTSFLLLSTQDAFAVMLSRPLKNLSLPLFITYLSFKECNQTLLLNHLSLLTPTDQNSLMVIMQGLLQTSQTSFPQSNIFDLLLPYLSPDYPPALLSSVAAVLYNTSLFASDLSPSSSNILISTFILYSSPHQLTSNNFSLFQLLGRIIHRLLHNRNTNLLYSLVNSLDTLKQILQRPISSLDLPDAFKIWDEDNYREYLQESKLKILVNHSEKILPILSNFSLSEAQLLTTKLFDEISTNQLQTDFDELYRWSLPIWVKEVKSTMSSVLWC